MKLWMSTMVSISLLAGGVQGGEERLQPVTSYEEIEAYGLEAGVKHFANGVIAFYVKPKSKTEPLPDWMEAIYKMPPDMVSAQPMYQFDPKKPNRVGAFFSWTAKDADQVMIVIGPEVRGRNTLVGMKYLAILGKDLLEWSNKRKDETK